MKMLECYSRRDAKLPLDECAIDLSSRRCVTEAVRSDAEESFLKRGLLRGRLLDRNVGVNNCSTNFN